LDLYLARSTAQLIKIDRPLFEQLIEVTNASYRSATRRVSQQDLIRAQLELTRLDDRLLRLNEIQDSRHQELAEWLPLHLLATPISWHIPNELAVSPVRETEGDRLYQLLSRHPELRSSDQSIAATRVGLRLAQEATKPDWALNAAYGYRDEDRFGNDLADFVTLGVTFQLPLFKKNRQNKQIAAAADLVSADESGRVARLQQLTRRYLKAYATLDSLDERLDLYQGSLLRQMDALAEASLNAYTTDAGDFADVMRAYVALLNAKIEAGTIEVNRLKVLAEIRYVAAKPEHTL
jgi:outer membrane protein TolC